MTASLILPVLGTVLGAAGVGGLYWRWRGARRDGARGVVLLGWLGVTLGLLAWAFATSPERGLALACLPIMAAAGALTLVETLRGARRERRSARSVEREADEPAAPGRLGRMLARLAGCLVAAPLFAVGVAMAWQAAGWGGRADRVVTSGFLLIVAFAGMVTAVLGVRRRWLLSVLAAAAGAVLAALALAADLGTGEP